MAEEKKKVEKKATTKASTTKKKTTTKKVEEKVEVKEKSQPTLTTDFSNISPELMQQMFAVFQAMQEQNKVVEEKVEEVEKVVEKPKKITKSYLRTIKDKEVTVRSVYGTVVFTSPKTSITYKWTEIGDEETLTVEEILAMESFSKRYLGTPWLVVEDEEVVEGLGYSELYSVLSKIEDVDGLLEMDIDEIEGLVSKAPNEHKKTLAGEIFRKVNSGEIRDIVLIKGLEKALGTTLLF